MPRLLAVVCGDEATVDRGRVFYEVAFGETLTRLLSLPDFVALARGAKREKHMRLPPVSVFPLRRFRKMSPRDDPRQHTKIIALVNVFLEHCSKHARDKTWWQVFCEGDGGDGDCHGGDIERRQQARAWNQYFTSAAEARTLMNVALEIMAEKKWKPAVWLEPAAGAGDICSLFPTNDDESRSVCVDIDPALCSEHGWLNRDFLGLSREDIFGKGPASPAMADVIVVTNPPFVAHAESLRDGGLAHAFVRHSLMMGDVVLMLLPERFARREEREAAIRGCHEEERVVSRVHGEVRRARFDLGAERFKRITQPCVVVSFLRE